MQKPIRSFFLCSIMLLGINACTAGQTKNTTAPPVQTCNDDGPPSYNNNGSFDDNGAEPEPNNCSQNFGRRW